MAALLAALPLARVDVPAGHGQRPVPLFQVLDELALVYVPVRVLVAALAVPAPEPEPPRVHVPVGVPHLALAVDLVIEPFPLVLAAVLEDELARARLLALLEVALVGLPLHGFEPALALGVPLLPDALEDCPPRVVEGAPAAPQPPAVLPLVAIALRVPPGYLPVGKALLEIALEDLASGGDQPAAALPVRLDPLPLVHRPVRVEVLALPVPQPFLEMALVVLSAPVHVDPLTLKTVVLQVPVVEVTVLEGHEGWPRQLPLLEPSQDVRAVFRIHLSSVC